MGAPAKQSTGASEADERERRGSLVFVERNVINGAEQKAARTKIKGII